MNGGNYRGILIEFLHQQLWVDTIFVGGTHIEPHHQCNMHMIWHPLVVQEDQTNNDNLRPIQ